MKFFLLALLLFPYILITSAEATPPRFALEPTTPIEVSETPKRFDLIAVDALHHRLLAAHSRAGTLTVVNLHTLKPIAEIPVGQSSGVAVDENDDRYFVGTRHGIAVVNLNTLRKTGFIRTPGPADTMVLDSKDDQLYVGHDDGKELWVIDAHHQRIIDKIAIPGVPELMVIDARTHRLYLNIKTLDEVIAIDTTTNQIIHHWLTPKTHSPHGLAMDLRSQRLFVAGRSSTVSVFSLPSGQPLAGIHIGPGRVDQVAYDSNAHRLYCPSSGRLVVIGMGRDSGTVLTSVKIPETTHSVAVDPDTHWVWIAYADGKHSYVQAFVPKN